MSEKIENIPKHVAIIMDGNGRWAEQRGKNRFVGHRKGAQNVQKIAKAAARAGVKILTLWALSTENWKRPKDEINYLMKLFTEFSKKEIKPLQENNARLYVIGDLSKFSKELQENINKAQKLTAKNTGLILIMAVNYSGKWDIVEASKKIAQKVKKGQIKLSDINEEIFAKHLSLGEFPNVDLLIRTGKELRISNFCLWQLAYTELYFTDVFWPDFSEKDLNNALYSYSKRERRFGGLKKKR